MTEHRPRRWHMFAGRDTRNGGFRNVGGEQYVRAFGHEPVAVVVTEASDGAYWGWLTRESWGERKGQYREPVEPVMVQGHKGIFDMQFPYAPEAEQERGHGDIVRLDITEGDAP